MKQGKKHAYNYSEEVTTQYGPQQVYINCYDSGSGGWIIRIEGPMGRLELPLDDFEYIAANHLRQMGYTLWSPDEKVAAWAMAHMAGYLRGEDDLKYINPFEQK